jgi:hypothetical protein
MLGRQERIALYLLCGVVVAVALSYAVLGTIGKASFAKPYTGSNPEGDLVILDGTVQQLTVSEKGGSVILSVNNVTVFIPSPAAAGISFSRGSRVTLFGIVQTYKGKKEIVIRSAQDIRTL